MPLTIIHNSEESGPTESSPLLQYPEPEVCDAPVTPLPKLQITILLVLQLSEPICSMSIGPYINDLIVDLGITGGDQRKAGYYAGIIISIFFIAEAMTILQWSRLSDRIGRRPVLLLGLTGIAISMLCFGLSRTFLQLVISRSLSGILNGNVGIFKSVMGEILDDSNRAFGFSFMPMTWCIGATIGSFTGGALAKPHERFPSLFIAQFWAQFPYFLPCLAVVSFTAFTFIVTAVFLNESAPGLAKPKQQHPEATSLEPTITPPTSDGQLALRELLTPAVVAATINYTIIALLDISLQYIRAVFMATPIIFGGVGMHPASIGTTLALSSLGSGIGQLLLLAPLIKWWGINRVHELAILFYFPIWILFPIMNLTARRFGVGYQVWALLGLQILAAMLKDLVSGTVAIFVATSAPSPRSRGATNGLAQTAVSIARAIGPASSTAAFAFSIEKNILNGYGVFVVYIAISAVAVWAAKRLPRI